MLAERSKVEGFKPSFLGESYFAYGDIRGYLEPCGCDPSSDLGGLKRIAAVRAKVVGLDKNTTIFDLGNFLPSWLPERKPNEDEIAKIKAISSSIKNVLKPDVVLLNELEFKWIENLKSVHVATMEGLNFVLTGFLKPKNWPKKIKVQDFYETKFGLVFGFRSSTESQKPSTEQTTWLQYTKEIIGKNKKFNNLKKVLLFAGTESELKFFLDTGLFDTILSSSTLPLSATVDNEEFNNPGSLYRNHGDKSVRMVPVGGQGIWIHGFSTESKKWIQPLSKIFPTDRGLNLTPSSSGSSIKSLNSPASNPNLVFQDTDLIWLTPSWGFSTELDSVMRKYNEIVAKNFKAEEVNRRLRAKDSKFVGAEACKSCHASSYEVWLGSAHSIAIQSLARKSKDRDSECVYCHVVGFHEGGFVSQKVTPHLSGVQCENCHGARKDHLANPYDKSIIYKDAKTSCVECHQGMHSPNFEYQRYWQQIIHK